MESNFFKKFKAIASLPVLGPYFKFKKEKEIFLRNSRKPAHGNLVLITSTVQVELSKLNFNFIDDIRSFKGLCKQITFVTVKRFCSLSKKNPHPCSERTISRWIEY